MKRAKFVEDMVNTHIYIWLNKRVIFSILHLFNVLLCNLLTLYLYILLKKSLRATKGNKYANAGGSATTSIWFLILICICLSLRRGNNTKALKAESIFYISTSAGLDQAFVKTFFHIIVYVSRLDFLIDNFDNAGNPDLSVMQRSTFPDSMNSINSTLREEKVLLGPSPVCQVEIENWTKSRWTIVTIDTTTDTNCWLHIWMSLIAYYAIHKNSGYICFCFRWPIDLITRIKDPHNK